MKRVCLLIDLWDWAKFKSRTLENETFCRDVVICTALVNTLPGSEMRFNVVKAVQEECCCLLLAVPYTLIFADFCPVCLCAAPSPQSETLGYPSTRRSKSPAASTTLHPNHKKRASRTACKARSSLSITHTWRKGFPFPLNPRSVIAEGQGRLLRESQASYCHSY